MSNDEINRIVWDASLAIDRICLDAPDNVTAAAWSTNAIAEVGQLLLANLYYRQAKAVDLADQVDHLTSTRIASMSGLSERRVVEILRQNNSA